MEERIERNRERDKGKEKEEEEAGELNVEVSSYSPFSSYERQGLPNEVLMLIFSFLRREIDLFNICLVCKRWKSLMDTDIIWQTILYRRYRQDRGALNMVMASFREEQEQQALEFSENLLFGSASSSDRDTAAPFANNSTSSVDEKTAWPDAYRSPTTFATSPTLFSPTTSTGTSISSSLDGTTSNSNSTSNSTSTSSSPSYSYSTPPKDLNWKRFYLTRLKQDRLWKLSKLGHQGTLVGHTEEIRCLALVGSRVITGSLDRSIRVWDATNYTLQNTLYNNVAGVLCLQPVSTKTSERGTKIITGNSDRTIKVWNIDSGLCTNTIHGHTGEVECLHVEDRFLVTGSRDTTVRVWDSSSYACLMTLEGHRAPINCIQVGGRTIVSAAADRTIKVWDLGTGTCLRTLNGKMNGSKQANILPSRQKGILCLQFNADSVVVGTGDSYLEMYDLDSLKLVRSTRGHNGPVTCLKYDEDKMVTGGRDNAVKLWDWNMWKVVHTLTATTARPGYEHGHRGAITCVDFNKNFLVTGSNDKTSIIWAPGTGSPVPKRVIVPLGQNQGHSNPPSQISSPGSGSAHNSTVLDGSFGSPTYIQSPTNNPIIPMSTFGSITTISSSPIIPTSTSARTMTSPPLPSMSSPVPLTYTPPLPRSATFIPPRAKPITVQPSPELSSRLGPAGELLDIPPSSVSLENLVAIAPASSTSSSSFTLTYHHSSSSSSDSASEARLSFERESEFDFSLPTSSPLVSLFSPSVETPTATSEMTTTTTTRTSLEGLSIGSGSRTGSRFEFKKSNSGSGFGSKLGLNLGSSRERADRRRDSEGRGSETEGMTPPHRHFEGTTTSTMSVENVLELMNSEEEGRTERHAGIYGFSEEDSMLPLSSGEKEKCILC